MAQIPTYGGLKVAPRAMPYTPWSTDIPKVPDSGFNDALAKASNAADKFYTKFLEEQDNARVTEALAKLRRHATDLESGENGYSKLLGENALKPDDQGRGLVERIDTDMQDFGSSLANDMTPRQQKLFREKALPIYQASYSGTSAHVMQQGVAYQQNAALSSIAVSQEEGVAYAYKPERLAMAEADIREQNQRLKEIRGLSDEQAEMELKKSLSGLYGNSIERVLNDAQTNPAAAYQAQGILREHGKDMLASEVAKYRTRVTTALDTYNAMVRGRSIAEALSGNSNDEKILGNYNAALKAEGAKEADGYSLAAFIKGILPVVSAGGHQTKTDMTGGWDNRANWKYGASQLTEKEAEKTAKRNGMVWDRDRFLNDRGYNKALGYKYFEECTLRFADDEGKAFGAYFTSPDTVEKAQKEAEAKGGTYLDYLPQGTKEKILAAKKGLETSVEVKDANGKAMSIFDPAYASRARHQPTLEEAREMAIRMDPRCAYDPKYLESVLSSAGANLTRLNQVETQKRKDLINQATEALWQAKGDFTAISPDVLSQLTPLEQIQLRKLAKSIADDDQSSDLQVKAALLTDEAALVAMDRQDLLTLIRGTQSLKDQQEILYKYETLSQKLVLANDEAGNRIRNAQLGNFEGKYVPESGAIREAAINILGNGYKDLQKEHPELASVFTLALQEEVARQYQTMGVKPDAVSLNQMVARASMNLAPIETLVGKNAPIWTVSAEKLPSVLPSDARALVTNMTRYRLKQLGITRDPTPREFQETFTRVMLFNGSLPYIVPNDDEYKARFDSALGRKIRGDWAEKHPNSGEMSPGQFIRAYLDYRINDVEAEGGATRSMLANIGVGDGY